jgi:hypothetical protein
MLGVIIGAVLLVLLGIWVFSAGLGLLGTVLGVVLIVAGGVWVARALSAGRGGPGI